MRVETERVGHSSGSAMVWISVAVLVLAACGSGGTGKQEPPTGGPGNEPGIWRIQADHGETDFKAVSAAGERGTEVARFRIDRDKDVLRYEISPELRQREGVEVALHGYAPPGWEAPVIARLESTAEKPAVWRYPAGEEQNIEDGLAYVTVGLGDKITRAQIMPVREPVVTFPGIADSRTMAGTCHLLGMIPGVIDQVAFEMEPAQVKIARGEPKDADGDGMREVDLTVAVRVGGAEVPGLGHIEIEMLGDDNPGKVVARQKGRDFPADMTFELRKRYITPVGTFISDKEVYKAEGITGFPPFGANIRPVTRSVKLYDEKTGEPRGSLTPGTIVALFNVDPERFPVRGGVEAPTPIEPPPPFLDDYLERGLVKPSDVVSEDAD